MARIGSHAGFRAGIHARSPTFKSLIWRIVFLHIVAVAVVAIFLPLVLFWLLNSEIDQLHRDAMRAQAEVLAERIVAQPDGLLTFNLPDSLKGLYSEAYGRYQYDIRDAEGHLLFSSRRVVTGPPRRWLAPTSPALRISRAMRLRPCRAPLARSSACTRGAP